MDYNATNYQGNNKKKILISFSLLVILAIIPLSVYLSQKRQSGETKAAPPDSIEAEGGVVSGAAKILSDAAAIGGRYILFDTAPTPAPTTPPAQTPTPPSSISCSHYVATNGNNSNNGTSTGTPWQTVQKAADSVPAGATICIRSGEYGNFSMSRSGTPTAPITFTTYPGDSKAIITGKNMPTGVNDFVVKIRGNHDVILRNLIVEKGRGVPNSQNGGGIQVDANADKIQIRDSIIRDHVAFGVRTYNATNVIIDGNEITQNAMGVAMYYKSTGNIISNNNIHDQDKMMTNTPGGNDDTGAQGVGFVKSNGKIIARNNRVWNNIAPSYDYTYDGGAFEIFGASDVEIVDNVTWDNDVILETGTVFSDPNPDIKGCSRNIFARNVAYNTRPQSTNPAERMLGIIVRCAQDNIIANNTVLYPTFWVFDVNRYSTSYSGYVDRAKILNNVLVMDEGKIFALAANVLDAGIVFDNNLLYNPGFNLADISGKGLTKDHSTLVSWGHNANGLSADPLFVDPAARNYRLKPNSPAINKGKVIPGITDGYKGSAPDLGAFEIQ